MSGFFANTKKPEGFGGKIMVAMMNHGHAALSQWGRGFLHLNDGAHVLDLGCGGGANLAALLDMYHGGIVTGLDYSPVSVEKAQKLNKQSIEAGRCQVAQGDVSALPFGESVFDLATAFETVYFWPDLERSFHQVHRVLKPGGNFLICNEADGTVTKQFKWCDLIDGMSICTSGQLSALLRAAGFIHIGVHQEPQKHWLCVTAQKPESGETI